MRSPIARVLLVASVLSIAITAAAEAAPLPPPPPRFEVDTGLRPEPRGSRLLARVVDGSGTAADFAADELVVTSSNPAVAKEIAGRWRGHVMRAVQAPSHDTTVHALVKIDPTGADLLRLPARVRGLSGVAGTTTRVSSEQGLRLIAAAAEEASAGHTVGLNWMARGDSIAGGSTRESASGPTGFDLDGDAAGAAATYTRDTYRWSHLAKGGEQDIGVTSAWTLLQKVGRLKRGSVKLGVLDAGFSPEANGTDFGPDPIAFSTLPVFAPLETRNPGDCGDSACPWHGTNVLNAAAAVPDNGVGAAGPAGPIARPIVALTTYDIFTASIGLFGAYTHGARIANMSFSARVPATLSWTVLPFDLVTDLLRDAGMLIYASAGNDGRNVDDEDCILFVCWEAAWHTPCENAGVVCVGGLAHRSKQHADGSNYGDQVDMYAPYTVLVGPDPDRDVGAQRKSGTSFSSPYVAGVAALARAAAPGASAGRITTALRDNANAGEGRAVRYVNAFRTVKDLLPRLIHISAPEPASTVAGGRSVRFTAYVYDDGRGAPTSVRWTLDGRTIGTGTSFTRSDLPAGRHTITATATFADGDAVSDRVELTVTNDPPRVEITAPATGTVVQQSQTLTFRGSSSDVNESDTAYRLRDDQVSWHLDGTRFATGHTAIRNLAGVAPGRHVITFRGSDGLTTVERSIAITVVEDTLNRPPSVRITAPGSGVQFDVSGYDAATRTWYRDVTFTTTASDPEGGPLRYAWSHGVDGGPATVLAATGATATVRLVWQRCGGSTHDVSVSVMDDAGQTSTADKVEVLIDGVPC
jgi:hypothetical protein